MSEEPVYIPSKWRKGKIVRIIEHEEGNEEILECPECHSQGTTFGCKDFTMLTLGYYLCGKCHTEFTVFSDDWRKNVKIAYSILDKSQQKAVNMINQPCIQRKKKRYQSKTSIPSSEE